MADLVAKGLGVKTKQLTLIDFTTFNPAPKPGEIPRAFYTAHLAYTGGTFKVNVPAELVAVCNSIPKGTLCNSALDFQSKKDVIKAELLAIEPANKTA